MPFSVLVVDDDPDTRVSLRSILEVDGYEVDTVGTAAEVLACDDWGRYGAVLLDRRLPDGTAEELLPRLRERAPDTAVVVVTGHADVRGAIEAFRLGAVDYALKPVDPDELRARLGRIAGDRRTREALRRREEELQAALDALPVGVWFTDADGRIEYGNPAARAIWGRALHAGSVGGEAHAGRWPGADQPVSPDNRALARALRGEPVLDEVVEIEAAGGARKVVLTSAIPLRADDGGVRGAVVINQDLTERKRAEDARLHFQALFESAPGMYLVLAPDLTIVGASDAFLRATMTRREEIAGRPMFDVFPDDPDDPAPTGARNLRASLERVLRDRIADVMPVQRYPVRRPESEGGGFVERYWSPLNSPVFGPDGELAYIVNRVEDVTEYVRARERGEDPGAVLESRNKHMEAEIFLRARDLARANRALRESVELFRGAFEDTNVATALADVDGRLLRTNAAFERLFGLPPGLAAGLTLADITHPEDRAECDLAREGLLEGPATHVRLEKRCIRRDGAILWGSTNLALIRDAEGRPVRYIVQIQDVTERVRAEAALRQSERRFRELLEGVALVAVMLDTEGRIVFGNDYLLRLTGWRREEVLGKSWFDLFVPDEVRADLRRVFFDPAPRDGIPAQYENEILVRTGGRRLIAWNNTVLRAPDGRAIGVTGLGEDITERRRAEEGLRESESRLGAILNTAAEAIMTVDGRGIIQTANPAAEALFGYSAGEMIGQGIQRLMPPSPRDDRAGDLARILDSRQARVVGSGREMAARRKDGAVFPIELAATPIDHLEQFTVIIRDLTQRKELEREVVEAASREQRRIGQDLHDTVGQELTALNILAGDLAETLPNDPAAAAALADRLIRGLRRSQQQLRVVMRGLLPVPVDRDGLMAALADLADRTRQDNPVECHFLCHEPVSVADNLTATHLYLIAQEAVHNAVKHARPRNIRIALAEHHGLVLQVSDDGVGLPSPPAEGRGLGMRIMHNRAAIIGARLTIEPAPSAGTVVTCDLTRTSDG